MYKCACALLLAWSSWCQTFYPAPGQTPGVPPPASPGPRLETSPTPRMLDERRDEIQLPDLESSVRPSGEAISVDRLKHAIPAKARKAYLRGKKLARSGKYAEAAVQFEAAVQYDPQFASAYNDLGVEYGRLGRLSQAQAALQHAVELDPNSWEAFFNLGYAAFLRGDLAAAEQNARRAVELSKTDASAHLLLGVLLYRREGSRAEGIQHIEYAARSLPQARQILQNIKDGKAPEALLTAGTNN